MRKIISLLLMVGFVCVLSVKAFADMASAKALLAAGDYVGARAEFVKIVNAGGDNATAAQFYIGHTYVEEKNFVKAREECAKAVIMPDEYYATAAQFKIGYTYMEETKTDTDLAKNYAKAREEYGKAALMSGEYAIKAQIQIGRIYELEKDYIKAQDAYVLAITKNISLEDLNKLLLEKLDATILGKEKYIECLNKILLIVPAKAENAEFLGQIKSEIEKLK